MITALLVGTAGLTFLLKAGGGLYWLIPAAVASVLDGVVNAWLFLVRVTSQSVIRMRGAAHRQSAALVTLRTSARAR
jgi:hypothetical protein